MDTTCIASLNSVRYRAQRLKRSHPMEADVSDRQERIFGFYQKIYSQSFVFGVGAGGLIGHTAVSLIRKGLGKLGICDHDTVEMSNLNRQYFYPEDLYKNKAVCLAKNLAKEGTMGSEIIGYPNSVQELVARRVDIKCNVAIVGVDNNDCRVFASKYFGDRGIPVIFIAVDRQADHGSVFIQESKPDTPCFGCLNPDAVKNPGGEACPSGASPDILQVVAGFAVYAVDTILMKRKRNWIYREFFLADSEYDGSRKITKRPDCPICGKKV